MSEKSIYSLVTSTTNINLKVLKPLIIISKIIFNGKIKLHCTKKSGFIEKTNLLAEDSTILAY